MFHLHKCIFNCTNTYMTISPVQTHGVKNAGNYGNYDSSVIQAKG